MSSFRLLEAALAETTDIGPAPADDGIARTSRRIPRAVLDEVSAVAQANRMSVSLIINLLLDRYLIGEGRSGYAELAPWYADYALRRKAQAD